MDRLIGSKNKLRSPWSRLMARLMPVLHYGDRPWFALIIGMALVVILLMVSIGWLLWRDSATARTIAGWAFLLPRAQASWNPLFEKFQAWPFIYGTLITSFVALIIALPISLGIAIFLAELSPQWLRQPISWMIELLAGIPSVVFGLWGIFIFLPEVVVPTGNFLGGELETLPGLDFLLKGPIPASGSSRLAAGLVLAIMIIPTIAAVSRDVFLAIPDSQREASLSLGATRWEMIWQVLIPYGLSGILGAVILGLGRALGETMAVTMVIGNSIEGSLSILRPGYTMSSVIANEFAEAVSALHSSALIYIGLALFIMSLLLNMLARFLVWQVTRRNPQEARA
jgi:phosphate transport system permease protein